MRLFIAMAFSTVFVAACSDIEPTCGRRCFGADGAARGDAAPDVPAGDALVDPDVSDPPPDGGVACGPAHPCINDQRCVGGACVAWNAGGFDGMCARPTVSGAVRPALQCEWSGPPTGDPYGSERGVLHTPVSANLRFAADPDSPTRPSIVFVSDASYAEGVRGRTCWSAGTLRVIDGATCANQAAATAPGDRVSSTVTPAIGDLDRDGRIEIVTAAADGGLIAFRVDSASRTLRRAWTTRLANGSPDTFGDSMCLWGGVTLADLDDDGRSEILFEGVIWSSDGVRLAEIPGWQQHVWGVPMIAADVDGDGRAEIVDGQGTWEYRGPGQIVREAYDLRRGGGAGGGGMAGGGATGFAAIADFGDFPGAAGDGPHRPEVVVVGDGRVQLLSIGGTELFSTMAPSHGGGPPTIADFDADGRPEIGAAFGRDYVVFDIDRRATLWSQPSQDFSSQRTGSSVFDFNADGRAEVVYGDECYVRVYDGRSGEVLFSEARYSATWEENPIVADVDGDSSAEIVMPMSGACRPGYCPTIDPIFSGLRCDANSDCASGSCSMGFCRCSDDAQCGGGYTCTDALAGTPGTGRVCRAAHVTCNAGLRVYRDAHDRWAPSRAVWNQHAYSITNIADDLTIPRSSLASSNWQMPGLNNFRQNTQGAVGMSAGADVTLGQLVAECAGAQTEMRAMVCNRGRAFMDAGIQVIFRHDAARELCRLRTSQPIGPGSCTPVSCTAPVPARGLFEGLVDPDGVLLECNEDNNVARSEAFCAPG